MEDGLKKRIDEERKNVRSERVKKKNLDRALTGVDVDEVQVGAADEVPDHDDDQLEPDDEGDGEQLLCARRARPLPGGQQAQPTHRLQQAAQPAGQLGVLGRRFLEKK